MDAKRWRFRSALLFTAGNALEIFTYIFPSLFFVTAALANALKQMAMLTSSATRNAIYKSFAKNSNNIGDITAKGEAQIAVIDLVGMFIGVTVSKCIGMSRHKITSAFLMVRTIDRQSPNPSILLAHPYLSLYRPVLTARCRRHFLYLQRDPQCGL